MKLQFDGRKIKEIAFRYALPASEIELIDLRPAVLQRGYLSRPELHKLAYWKSPRSSGRVLNNPEAYVREITGFALSTRDERTRVQVLTILDGVSWPTASVILHLFHRDPYPIMDYRALWSVGSDVPSQYGFPFWWKYVAFCRKVSERCKVDMRTLDRALWQYSKENQP